MERTVQEVSLGIILRNEIIRQRTKLTRYVAISKLKWQCAGKSVEGTTAVGTDES